MQSQTRKPDLPRAGCFLPCREGQNHEASCRAVPSAASFCSSTHMGAAVMVYIGSPSHFRGVWASPAPRREAPRGRTTPRLPVNDWGKVPLACTCVTSHATYKKKAGRGWNPYPLGLFDLRHPYPLSQKAREYEQPVD